MQKEPWYQISVDVCHAVVISGYLRSPGQQVPITESTVSWETVSGTRPKGAPPSLHYTSTL